MPTQEQIKLLSRYFWCCRFVYNYYLNKSIQDYQQNKDKKRDKYKYVLDLVRLKKQYIRLKEANSQSLQAVVENLDKAYNSFSMKLWQFPNFKRVNKRQSVKIPQFFKVQWDAIYIPKVKKPFKFVKHRNIEWKPKSLTISKDEDWKYYVSILVEKDILQDDRTNKEVGIDLWLKDLAITSDGTKYKTLKQDTTKIDKLKIILSKKQKWSRRYKELKTKISKLHKANDNKREDYLHKISRDIVKDYDFVGLETLDIRWMASNPKFKKNIYNQGWYSLVSKIIYKWDRYGKEVHQINKWYPTSKQCSQCGNVKKLLKLSERQYNCEQCGYTEDRDINASKNILKYAKIDQ